MEEIYLIDLYAAGNLGFHYMTGYLYFNSGGLFRECHYEPSRLHRLTKYFKTQSYSPYYVSWIPRFLVTLGDFAE